MSSTRRNIAIVYSIFLVASVFLVSHKAGAGVLVAILYALLVLGDMMATLFFLKRKSLISFAFCVIPAIFIWMFLCDGCWIWPVVSVVCSAAAIYVYSGRLPDTRPTTDAWIGSLILTIILCVTPFIVYDLLS